MMKKDYEEKKNEGDAGEFGIKGKRSVESKALEHRK